MICFSFVGLLALFIDSSVTQRWERKEQDQEGTLNQSESLLCIFKFYLYSNFHDTHFLMCIN